MWLLDFTLILKPVGELLFDSQIRETHTNMSIVCLCIGVIYVLLPVNRLLDFLHSEEFDLAEQTFAEMKESFPFNYDTLHPLKVQL